MLQNLQKTTKKEMFYSNLYSHNLVVLPYDYHISEDCLRQFSNIVERRLKRDKYEI